jgi:hypothetical protein
MSVMAILHQLTEGLDKIWGIRHLRDSFMHNAIGSIGVVLVCTLFAIAEVDTQQQILQ